MSEREAVQRLARRWKEAQERTGNYNSSYREMHKEAARVAERHDRQKRESKK